MTTELPAAPPAGATAAGAAPATPTATGPIPVATPPAPPQPAEQPAPAAAAPGAGAPGVAASGAPAPGGAPAAAPTAEGPHPTVPVARRPRIGARGTFPLTRMGPWAPVAGAVAGVLAGLLVVLLLGGVAEAFRERLALVFLTVGLGMLGAAGALLADEVRLVRRGAREAGIRPAWVEATANLINGLTPARLLLLASAFVLFLSAYVSG
ncbi:hypothetical protein SAMN05428965_4301 [Geodermatophilus sp. DSM 45219]|nr:hypothetical protein SAMN05428965_4301 [Geodermatophilus sp. DSM 45219]